MCLSPHLQRAREHRADAARARPGSRPGRSRARDRRQLARRDGQARRRARAGARLRRRAPPRAEGRTRARRISPGFATRSTRGAELIVEMDCDFSHDPNDVPRLLEAAETADVVLGSRYVPGGGVENWNALRRLHLVGRLALCADGPRRARARPDRRLQVHPARRARGDRPGRDPLARLRVPDRADLPRAPQGVPGAGDPDPLRRPPGRAARRCHGRSCWRRSGRCR